MQDPQVDYQSRCHRVQERLAAFEADYLLIGPSTDLLYLIGLNRPQSERLTMLMLPREGRARLVLPSFERALAEPLATFFDLVTWEEAEDPAELLASLLPRQGKGLQVAIASKLFTHFLFRLQEVVPATAFVAGGPIMDPVRMRKEEGELEHLTAAGAAADRVFHELLTLPLVGMSEAEVKARIMELMPAAGHDTAGGAIVGVGPNGASPHHHVTERQIATGDAVIVDFGGTVSGYWSDMTRTFHVGEPSEKFKRAFDAVNEANQLAFEAVRPGVTAEQIDQAARAHISQAGFGEYFLHRTGHGLGLDIHEPPYIVEGDQTVLESGMVFSIEPGIYIKGEFGIRIEDIVTVTENGCRRFNESTHALQIV
jgi:D-alanyl-D-alanine dipeptidase